MVPLHTIRKPSVVRRQTPSKGEDLGPGNTKKEALESTRNSQLERISWRNRKDILHCLGSVSGTGSEKSSEKLAGWTEVSTCQTTSFLTRNRVSDSSELYNHASCGTSWDQENQWNNWPEPADCWEGQSSTRARLKSPGLSSERRFTGDKVLL